MFEITWIRSEVRHLIMISSCVDTITEILKWILRNRVTSIISKIYWYNPVDELIFIDKAYVEYSI